MSYAPQSPSAATLSLDSGGPLVQVVGFNTAINNLSINGGAGEPADAINIVGSPGNDLISLVQGGLGTRATVNPGVAWVRVDFSGFESIEVTGGLGNDTLAIDESAGLIVVAGGIAYSGGRATMPDSLRRRLLKTPSTTSGRRTMPARSFTTPTATWPRRRISNA